ncbi:MAG TPA: helix-turn-helix transcriptional regulator [Candidatus Eisenbacteria bacterium]|nr:helix-turn-helix transcriptional regulator [Candidatus Eisenbacteria bacterium]
MPTKPEHEVLVALGRAVRSIRLERGYSQERLAEESGLHPRYVSDVELGKRNVGMVNVDRLAVALSVDLSTLMAKVEAARASSD